MDLDCERRMSMRAGQRVRLIGLPTDSHSSFLRGAAGAPAAIRAALESDHSNRATESGDELGIGIAFEDAGDLPLREDGGDPALISDAVEAAAREGAVPLCLGGDHMVSFPILAGLARVHGPVSILHFDAHPDLYDSFEGNRLSHACPFARVMEDGLAARLVQVGIRAATAHQREQARRFGVETVFMDAFSVDAVPVLDGPLYVTIDLDGLDPAFVPGVAHPEPGGLTVREVLAVMRRMRGPIVGADVVELNPQRDPLGLTAAVAAKLVKELAALAAGRNEG